MTLAFDVLVPITLVMLIPVGRDIYRGFKKWATPRIEAGNKFMEERDKFNSANAEKERLKKEKETNA